MDLSPPNGRASVTRDGRWLSIETPALSARLDARRGLAIDSLAKRGEMPLIGGVAHGAIDDIALSADWYTGNCVFEAPGEPKITDLERCEPAWVVDDATGDVSVTASIATPLGPIVKTLTFSAHEARVDCDIVFDWKDWGRGSLRLAHVTLKPDAFDAATLAYRTHNGGAKPETFSLSGETVDHGAPVSFLVSASGGVGMTEGWLEIGDGRNTVRLLCDRATAACIGLVEHKTAGGTLFCRLMLSALELDDTRKPLSAVNGPRRVRYAISL